MPLVPPSPVPSVATACARLADQLPDEVDGAKRRETDPTSDLTAAWGDPPIVLRCGVEQPDAYDPTAELQTVNDVDWLPVEADGGYVFYTTDRVAWVEVRVPTAYAPEVNPLVDLAAPISATIPTLD